MFTKATILSARLGDVSPLGAAASRLWAAAGVSSDLTGGVKAPCPKPKLPKTEADTVPPSTVLRFARMDVGIAVLRARTVSGGAMPGLRAQRICQGGTSGPSSIASECP